MGNVGSKTRSLSQIIENPYVHNRGFIFRWIFIKLCDKVLFTISRSSSKLGHVGSKTRSLGNIFEKPCVYNRGIFFFNGSS